MKKIIILFINLFLFLTIVLPITGCGFRHLKTNGEEEVNGLGQLELSGPISYSQIHEKIMAPKCLQCHSDSGGNQGSVNLENYDQVIRHLEGIKQKTLVEQTMPPNHPLNVGEKSFLKNWITNGAPAGAGGTGGGQNNTNVKVIVKWERIKNEIIANHCLQCHSPPNSDPSRDKISTMEAGLDLTSLEVVREKADLIFKRAVILSDMPLSPYPSLSNEEKKLLSQWMIDGMQEDKAQ